MKNKWFILLFVACVIRLNAQDYTPNYQLINNQDYPTSDLAVAMYNVLDYGADPTGVEDNTDIFQTLLDKAAGVGVKSGERGNYANPAGGIVYVPEGTYLVKRTLYIPRGVTLRGDWRKPDSGVSGTVIALKPGNAYGKGSTSIGKSMIVMQPSTEISHLSFWYPDQKPDNIIQYAPTILMGQSGYWGNEYCNVRHVTFVNSYIALQFNHNNGGGCPNVFDVYGTPLHDGLIIDALADVGRLDGIHFSAKYWEQSGLADAPAAGQIDSQLYEEATGITMRRNDWSYTCNVEIEGYFRGFYANKGLSDGNQPNGQNYGWEMRKCKTGVYIDATSYAGYMYTRVNTPGCEIGVWLDGGAVGPSMFYGCQLEGSRSAILMNTNATSPLMMQDCTVSGRTDVLGGELVANGCSFNNEVLINPIARMLMNGNTFTGGGKLTNNSIFKCEESDDRISIRPLPDFKKEWMQPQTTRPAKAQLYVVSDCQPVSIDVDLGTVSDCSEAIQRALNLAGSEGGGVVYLPSGHYRLDHPLTIPDGVELKGSSDVATVPKGNGAILEVMTGEGQENGTPLITMGKGSGLRGITINYPTQDNPAAVKKFPYAVRGNADTYIVNLSLRAAYRGVDLFTEKCDRHYVDYIGGHAFLNVIRVGNGSENGIISNIQCNTIAYACGNETKFGAWPNSKPENGNKCYAQNMEDLDFMIVGDCHDEVLYNNFLYGCNKGMIFQNDGQGGAVNVHSMGNAVDGAVNTFVINGIATDLDLVNSQVVALNHKDNVIRKSESATFVTLGSGVNKQVTLFSSCHWGGGDYFAKVQGGTLCLPLTNFNQTGAENGFTIANNAKVVITTSRFQNINKFSAVSGTDEQRATLVSSVLDLKGATRTKFAKWEHNIDLAWVQLDRSSYLNRSGWTVSASVNNGNSRRAIDGDDASRWDTGTSQKNGQWLKVDMSKAQSFNTLVLDATGSPSDGPAGYLVEISDDDNSWTEVASGEDGGAMMFIGFENVTARYIRITQTGSKSNYWSIHELNVANMDIKTMGIQPPLLTNNDDMDTTVYTLEGKNVNTSNLSPGIYVIVKSLHGKCVSAKKIIVK